MRTGDSTCSALPLPDADGRRTCSSGSGVVCFVISSVMISWAGSFSVDFAFLTAVTESVGLLLLTRFLKERVDWLAAVGPVPARRVLGGILLVFSRLYISVVFSICYLAM